MQIYVDTSLLVTACTREPRSDRAQEWLEAQDIGVLLTSEWAKTEFAAAISMKVRSGSLPKAERAEAFVAFDFLLKNSFRVAAVSTADFVVGGRFAEQSARRLRAGDALHLAICHAHGAALATFDADQRAAGEALGLPTIEV